MMLNSIGSHRAAKCYITSKVPLLRKIARVSDDVKLCSAGKTI